MNADDFRHLGDDDLARERKWLLAHVPGTTHTELLTYQKAAEALGVKYERVAGLVSRGVLIAEKQPRDAKKYIGSDQIDWYQLKQQGKDEGHPNPVLIREEASRRAAQEQIRAESQSFDTWTELRRYVNEHMESTDTATQLNTLLAAIAGHIAGTLVMESLPDEERETLAALLSAIIQKGR